MAEQASQLVEHFFRRQYGKMVSQLTRLLGPGELDFAEDCVQAAMLRAMRNWAEHGLPADPEAWLFVVARNIARDGLRRNKLERDFLAAQNPSAETDLPSTVDLRAASEDEIADDQLRLIFLCADPEIPIDARLALTLKIAVGFGISEIARALLVSEATIQKRITRAKQKLRAQESLSLELSHEIARARINEVQLVIYLMFNEGYFSGSSQVVIRRDLCEEAIRLASLLESTKIGSLPSTSALLALMYFHAARFDARIDTDGPVLFEDQDRSLWDWRLIRRGMSWMKRSILGHEVSRYHLESAIAWEHCRAASAQQTDWQHIAQLYQQLQTIVQSPTILINLAYAEAQFKGHEAAFARLQDFPSSATPTELAQCETLLGYLHAQAGRTEISKTYFRNALEREISSAHRSAIQKIQLRSHG